MERNPFTANNKVCAFYLPSSIICSYSNRIIGVTTEFNVFHHMFFSSSKL